MSGEGDGGSAFDITILADLREATVKFDLTPTEWSVLAALVAHSNGDRLAWPSQSTLVKVTGFSDRSVRRTMASLADRGALLVMEAPSRERNRAGRYLVLPTSGHTVRSLRSDVPEAPVTQSGDLRPQVPPKYPCIETTEDTKEGTTPSAPSSRRRGSRVSSSPAGNGRSKGLRERKPTSVTQGLSDPEAARIARAIYDARMAAGHSEVSAPKSRFMARYAGAVYDLMHAPHPVAADEIMAAVQDAIERGRRYLGPPALADIVTEHRQSQMTTRRNRTHGSSHRAGADPGNDYNGIAFDPGAI